MSSNFLNSDSFKKISWHLVIPVSGDPPPSPTDHNLLDLSPSLKSVDFIGPQLIEYVCSGLQLDLKSVGLFTNDPNSIDINLPGFGLVAKVIDASTLSDITYQTNIGGLASDPSTGQPPVPITYGYPLFGSYDKKVFLPVCKVYTTGYAMIAGNVDIRAASNPGLYGPGGSLIGQTFSAFGDQGSGDVTIGLALDEGGLLNIISFSLSVFGVFAMLDNNGNLVLASFNPTAMGLVGILSSPTATLLGFPSDTSKSDGTPNFGQLNPNVKLDAKISIFVEPAVTIAV